ncbi:hypothetical protein ACHAWO_005961 [Cyclotella atomus]|uniref:Uncharacterized protein n=1 Tax=Cyclotella atomus TaxID=382360 RepID=A0ABD3NNV5_9STRA
MKAIRRSSMIQEVPAEFSERVVVNHGTDGQPPSTPSKPSAAVKDITIKSLVIASMFVVFLFKANTSIFRFNTPSRVSLLDEIDHLKHDLKAYEALKEQYVNEEMQLQWDKQHITESEEVVTSMIASSKDLSDRFHDVEQHMKEENDHMHEGIQAASKSSTNAAKHDHETVMKLSKDIQETNAEARHAHEETVSLRRQISEMMEELSQKNIKIPEQIYDKLNALK